MGDWTSQASRFLRYLAASLTAGTILTFSGCFTPEILTLQSLERGKLYIVSRICFENFQIEPKSQTGVKRDCFVIFSARRGDYRGVGFGKTASLVRTSWGKYFVHALPKSGGDRPASYFIESVYLALEDQPLPVLWLEEDQFELLFDLRLDYRKDSVCVYIGDITFSLKGNDLFVAVVDHYDEAQAAFASLWKNEKEKPPVLEKRLLTGSDFVEIRKTSKKHGKVNHKEFVPTF
ncbi:MAG: hypothetical protein JXD23_09560 [Spirochaetales bacterium]|nr:hypothetical protein [Spirochaetales bacterium]